MPVTRRRLGKPTRPAAATTVKGLLLGATLVTTLSGCLITAVPDNRPTIVVGQSNGALRSSLLVSVNGCLVHRDAAPSLRAMILGAARSGITISGGSCYRDYAGQVAARTFWCNQGSCGMAATPGTSNHGWGKAVDIATTGSLTYSSPAYRWMKTYAWLYGWNHPSWAEPNGSSPEAWHWEWVGDGGTKFARR